MSLKTTLWWQHGVIYQIYPRSFQDSNADGVGDLAGILSRLDYLVGLGIDAIWISPFYPSPMADFGYDVSDYCGVDPLFGTLDDFDRLIEGIHQRGLKLILDFVPNHTSDQHPWFLESRSSRTNPKRDWYLWHDPAPDGGLPNNWMSHFGGPAWALDEPTGQYYLHSFLAQQPDVNWRNPQVRDAIFTAMLFWLDRGVDGFRMDVLWLLIKDDLFRNNPPNPDWRPGGSSYGTVLPLFTADRPETLEIVAQMRLLLDSYFQRVLIGEIYLPIKDLVRYYGSGVPAPSDEPADLRGTMLGSPELTGAQMPFNFHLIQTAWQAPAIARLIRDYEAALPRGAWPNWVLGNHDQSRLATRLGSAQARVAAMLLLTLRGTPTLYYGDELGMADGAIPADQVQDPAEKNQPGIGMGRDPERTPMQWDDTANAGFSPAEPWLPVEPGFAQSSVSAEDTDPGSMLSLYRTLLALRRTHPALNIGSISEVRPDDIAAGTILSYIRQDETERFQILLNLTGETLNAFSGAGRVVLSTGGKQRTSVAGEVKLAPAEGLLIQLD